jgi:hypothetical protein
MPFPAGLLYLIAVLLIAGVLLWAVNALPALDATIKQFIKIVIIVIVAIYVIWFLLSVFTGGGPLLLHR